MPMITDSFEPELSPHAPAGGSWVNSGAMSSLYVRHPPSAEGYEVVATFTQPLQVIEGAMFDPTGLPSTCDLVLTVKPGGAQRAVITIPGQEPLTFPMVMRCAPEGHSVWCLAAPDEMTPAHEAILAAARDAASSQAGDQRRPPSPPSSEG